MDDLENNPKPNFKPKGGRSFFIGAGISFLLNYLASYFIWSIRTGRMSDFPVTVWLEALVPSLIVALLGGFVGRIVADIPQPKHAALLGSLIFGVFGVILGPAIIGTSPYQSGERTICTSSAFAAIGAIVGGIVAISNRDRIESDKIRKCPRFFLSEMLIGFFLMSVIFACLTALIRPSH